MGRGTKRGLIPAGPSCAGLDDSPSESSGVGGDDILQGSSSGRWASSALQNCCVALIADNAVRTM